MEARVETHAVRTEAEARDLVPASEPRWLDDREHEVWLALRHLQCRLLMRFITQAAVEVLQIRYIVFHAASFQFKIIFRQAGSSKAVR